MKEFSDDQYCFVCGRENPFGLHLKFEHNPDTQTVSVIKSFPREFQGWHGVLHGGIISTVLDETMFYAVAHRGIKCVTAELTVRFKHAAKIDTIYTISADVTDIRDRLIFTKGKITDPDNKVVATAIGKFIKVE